MANKEVLLKSGFGRYVLWTRIVSFVLMLPVTIISMFFFSRWEDGLGFFLLGLFLGETCPRVDLVYKLSDPSSVPAKVGEA